MAFYGARGLSTPLASKGSDVIHLRWNLEYWSLCSTRISMEFVPTPIPRPHQ
jgi:hypothetical protein